MQAIYHSALWAFRATERTATARPARTGGQDDRRRLMAIMDLGGRQPWGRGL